MPVNEHTRPEAFLEHAMAQWGPTVYRLALNQTRSPQDADDVAQDVFLRLHKDRTAFQDDEHLKAWLIRTTINRCNELRRSAWARRVVPTEDAGLERAMTCTPPAARLMESDVWDAVGRLPDGMRLIVHLHYFEGYPLDEVARMTRCNPATVRTRLHRARKRLKLDLEEEARHEAVEPA
ncbi:RNA polymerase sigma factor [Arabiibacter massiliensis]|uniref:RNA polymerase sigma factor n=1 Tax=Arabiibacter massiliensis TaxID=1870985 RepID=UPI001E2E7C28|nr:sigma-70 family RNA polymerase sigma factor [Arabiibacter massiliensis]